MTSENNHAKMQKLVWHGYVRPFDARIPETGREDGLMERLKDREHRIVGTKQVLRAMKAGKLVRAYVANDVDTFLFQQVVRSAESAGIPVTRVDTMKALGEACGVQVGTAAAGILRG